MLALLDDVVGDVAAAVPRGRLPADDATVVGRLFGQYEPRRLRMICQGYAKGDGRKVISAKVH